MAGAVQARRRGPTIAVLVDWTLTGNRSSGDRDMRHLLTAGLCRLQRVVHVRSDPWTMGVGASACIFHFLFCCVMAWHGMACSSLAPHLACQGYSHYYYLEGLGLVHDDAIGTCVLSHSPGPVKSNHAANHRPASAVEAIEAFSVSAIVCAVHNACYPTRLQDATTPDRQSPSDNDVIISSYKKKGGLSFLPLHTSQLV